MFSIQHLGLVLIGGGIGSICRYVATTLIGSIGGTVFPFGTLFVNLLGSFLMGFLMFFFLDEHFTLPETLRLFLAVGFLGGFTTFSSFSMESLLLLRGDSFFYALRIWPATCCSGCSRSGSACRRPAAWPDPADYIYYNAIVQDSATRNPSDQRFNEARDITPPPGISGRARHLQR